MLNPDDILERTQWDFFWVPGDVRIIDRPELLYSACPRDVLILNTVTRTRAGPNRLPAIIDEVTGAHASVRSRWLVRSIDETTPLKEALAQAGYAPAVETHAVAIEVDAYEPRPTPGISVRQVLDMSTLRDRAAVLGAGFGEFREFTEEELEADLAQCQAPEPRVQQFVAYDDQTGQPISAGGMTLFPDLQFGFLWAGCTVPEARGRGAYSAVLAARIQSAHELGCRYVGLYAITNTSAPIVRRQGFKEYGTMTYWEKAPTKAGVLIRPTSKPKASFKNYDSRFPVIAQAIIESIKRGAPDCCVEHIGSTAVPGCPGKGIIDLMLVYPVGQAVQAMTALEMVGFHPQGPEFRHRDSFPDGHLVRIGELDFDGETFRSYVHAVPEDSHEVERFRMFRNRLRENPGLLAKYVAVKHAAIDDGVTDTDDYVVRKIAVIKEILEERE